MSNLVLEDSLRVNYINNINRFVLIFLCPQNSQLKMCKLLDEDQ